MKDISSDKARYAEYLNVQRNRSLGRHAEQTDKERNRKDYLVALLSSKVDLKDIQNALVIGCRNSYELDLLEKVGIKRVTGVDLFSFDKRIKIMDMHDLKFPDNQFDLVYCSHALEHAFDYAKVLTQIKKVIKDNGLILIEVPVNYETRGADIHDFESSENLINILKRFFKIKEICFTGDLQKEHPDNFSGTDVARIIVRVSK